MVEICSAPRVVPKRFLQQAFRHAESVQYQWDIDHFLYTTVAGILEQEHSLMMATERQSGPDVDPVPRLSNSLPTSFRAAKMADGNWCFVRVVPMNSAVVSVAAGLRGRDFRRPFF